MGKLPARVAVVVAFSLALCLPHAPAAFGEVKVFPTEGMPLSLTAGPDGNMWFTDPGTPPLFSAAQIGSVTPAGAVSKYTPGLSGYPWGIAKGPDGNIWFTEPSVKKVGFIKPSEPATSVTECEVPGMPAEPTYRGLIATGPDGNLWVTLGVNGVARVTPACAVTEFRVGLNAGANVCSITAGPDGNVWFGDCGTPTAVGKITPAGAITEYEVASPPESIIAGPDGNLWFTQGSEKGIGRITPSGTVTTSAALFPSSPTSITAGPDGNLWATDPSGENETQTITLKGESGSFKLGFEGQQTGWTGEGTLTSGSTSVTGVTTTTGSPTVGELITGTGIKANTRITACSPATSPACTNPTSITFSQAAEASGKQSLSADLGLTSTSALPYSTTTIKTALAKLSSFGGSSNLTVGGSGGLPNVNRSVTFIGKFERTNVSLMPCDGSKLTIENEETEEFEPGSCTVTTTTEARPSRLFRIKPTTGAMKEFPLELATQPQPFVRANALASDGAGNLWFTVIGGIARFGVPIYRQLNIIVEGPGTVLIEPGGVTCPPLCEPELALGSTITLTADPDQGAAFVSWKGCDTVNGRQCSVTMDKARAVIATFVAAPELTVSKAPGSGLGKVTSYPGGILCLANCSTTTASFKEGAKVKLTATPSKHFHFVEWLGACTGSGFCEVTMDKAREVKALFAEDPKHSLTLTKDGNGAGTVKSLPVGINCGPTCSSTVASFYEGELIELTALPGKGSTFEGWFGGGCSGTGTCKVTISAAKSVIAVFGPTIFSIFE